MPNPPERLSPNTRILFISPGLSGELEANFPNKIDTARQTRMRALFITAIPSLMFDVRRLTVSRFNSSAIQFFYGKLRYQWIRSHRAQRASGDDAKTSRARSRDKRSH